MGKRGQSNMFWIIIAAVIALVVMIVLLLLFTGKTNMLEKPLTEVGLTGPKKSVFNCLNG